MCSAFLLMAVRYFTREEANASLVELEPLMGRLLERRAKATRLRKEVSVLLEAPHTDLGGPIFSELARDFVVIEELVQRIRSTGCVIKSLEAGLLDFLTELDGRDVYLCWRYGEAGVSHYHELHTGFRERRKLD
jgi:hypothetical protein